MNKKVWIVWALFLLLPGAVGLSIHYAQKTALQRRIAVSASQIGQDPTAKEYLQMHEQWAKLSAEEKANNPWGYGLYGGQEIQNRLQEGQFDRLAADLPSLQRGVTHYPEEMAAVMYGSGWQQIVEEYQKQLAVSEIILISSTFLIAIGGLILVGGIFKAIIVLIVNRRKNDQEQTDSLDTDSAEFDIQDGTASCSPRSSEKYVDTEQASDIQADQSAHSIADSKTEISESSKEQDEGYFQSHKKTAQSDSNQPEAISGEFSTKPTMPPKSKVKKPKKDSYFGWAVDLDDSSDFETLMTTEPLTKELTELTEEVSAIRQFAAQQQDQMRKLQDGYDWMIIRRFCLRIIRSIDNIDDRISHLQEQQNDASVYLEDIRDELIFALESSGIEQFKPDLNITFKGLEKYAEAVRERALTKDDQLSGCIAQVVRPGYQYLVSDDDVKIVRCAQVKLYETKPTQ